MDKVQLAEILDRHSQWLLDNNKGARANLHNADLRSADLHNADLRHANLRRTILCRASLNDANLDGANLNGANLHHANLYCTNLHRANLRNANLVGANLHRANLYRADLRGANLDYSVWPLWCGSLAITLDERQQAQLLYHVLAVSPKVRALTPPEMIAFANSSHVVQEHGCMPIPQHT